MGSQIVLFRQDFLRRRKEYFSKKQKNKKQNKTKKKQHIFIYFRGLDTCTFLGRVYNRATVNKHQISLSMWLSLTNEIKPRVYSKSR